MFKGYFIRLILFVFIVLFSLSLSIVIDYTKVKNNFEVDVNSINTVFLQNITTIKTVMLAVTSLHQATDNLNDAQLSSFSDQLIKSHSFIESIFDVKKLKIDEQKLFEQNMQKNGFINFKYKHLKQAEKSNNLDYLLPITFIEPMTPITAQLLGLDIQSLGSALPSIANSIDKKTLVASDITTFGLNKNAVMVILKAHYLGRFPPEKIKERQETMNGFVGITINSKNFLAELGLGNKNFEGTLGNVKEKRQGNNIGQFNANLNKRMLTFSKRYVVYNNTYQLTLKRPITFAMFSLLQALAIFIAMGVFTAVVVFLLTKNSISKKTIKHLAYFDHLTNLPNRVAFKNSVDEALKKALTSNRITAVLFMDLDGFKTINDTLGHDVGDELLIQISKRLAQQIRESSNLRQHNDDTVARLGGDEFTVLLDGIGSPTIAGYVADRLLNSIEQPFILNNQTLYITLSIGIAMIPTDGNTVEEVLKNADAAMYHAKAQGKNNYQFYTESLSAKINARHHLENKLRSALENDEFELYYQPQIDIKTNDIVGVEALIRWNQPEIGMVSPVAFIPIAEDTGLIVSIGLWVIDHACLQNKKWQNEGLRPISVAVNLSAVQFGQANLEEEIEHCLKEAELDAEYLKIEITETIMANDIAQSIKMVKKLAKIGIKISIDDFGTGYSSLSYLTKFPAESLKIDKSFMDDIPHNKENMLITTTIISMAKSLGLKVIAEGVEKEEQYQYLVQQECDIIQGYYFSKPVTAKELAAMLAKVKTVELIT